MVEQLLLPPAGRVLKLEDDTHGHGVAKIFGQRSRLEGLHGHVRSNHRGIGVEVGPGAAAP